MNWWNTLLGLGWLAPVLTYLAARRSSLVQRMLLPSQIRQNEIATDVARLTGLGQAGDMLERANQKIETLRAQLRDAEDTHRKEITDLRTEFLAAMAKANARISSLEDFVKNAHRSAPQIGVHVSERGILSVLPGAPILVVDDDADIATSLRMWLEEDNYDVTTAKNVPEALAAINARHVALAIVDLYLGDDTALPIAQAIRSGIGVKPTQIVLMTAATDSAAQKLISMIDPVATISKPFDMRQLGPVVKTALAKRETAA